MTCELQVSTAEHEKLHHVEAVCIYEYERGDGSRFAVIGEFGDLSEMKDRAERFEMFIVFEGDPKLLGKVATLVTDLAPPAAKGAEA